MLEEYSVEACRTLEQKFRLARLHRPMRVARYDAGTELVYDVTGVEPANRGRIRLVVEKFVGGGFAGQVYRVRVSEIESEDGAIGVLEVGGVYAMKILIPPSNFSLLFRNLLYWIGFQGPFQLQVNPAAARAGALWQKFIRRAAKIRFGDEKAVVDIHATFVDSVLGSCGELSEWVDGRTWKLEVNDRLDLLSRCRKGGNVNTDNLGSPEYRAKRKFMRDFVTLLHDIGGHEFARQYEWSTCKSQPNCLKRRDTNSDPLTGLTAVDFRAGLALLPFLPMSPGDFKLILDGFKRGSLVQFDRGDIHKLEAFVKSHGDSFTNMQQMLEELKTAEKIYRNSLPDITHNHIRLFYSKRLWSTILDSAVTGWKVRNLVDLRSEKKLRDSRFLTVLYFLTGLIPFFGRFIRKVWGREEWRKHYGEMLTSWGYLKRAFRARVAEKVIVWHRQGRVTQAAAIRISDGILRFSGHLLLSILPAGLHRFMTDWQYARGRIAYILIRPVRLYFNAELREQWLVSMLSEGQKKHMLSDEDAEVVLSQVNDPFIQKYLKSLAVHVCTLPVTQMVSVTLAIIYVVTHPELPRAQALGVGAGIIALFQVVPISPGSLVRGLYVLYLVIRERNFKDYNIAVFLGFFKYVGYLAFPIQMTYHYPAMARFMAGHWATEAVRIVPVFGEGGALLEHWVFNLFYNWPLTIQRRMRNRGQLRAKLAPRYWHVGVCAVVAGSIFVLADWIYLRNVGQLPALRNIWWLCIGVPLACGAAVTLGCGGAALWRRIVAAGVCGVMTGLVYTAASFVFDFADKPIGIGGLAINGAWRAFIFGIWSIIGNVFTELKLPDPDLE